MGRKQKLRQEKKRNIKNKAAATAEVTAVAAAAAAAATFSTENAIAETAEEKALARHEERALAIENQLPKSDVYVQAMAGTDHISHGELLELFKRGATEDGCVHSMYAMGVMLTDAHMCIALPWFLEGAIRGSCKCILELMEDVYFPNRKADALQRYWWTIPGKYYGGAVDKIKFKNLKDLVERECIICSKTDTKTLTLKQCEGCSVYCYCSEECQIKHWEERKHRNECKQVHILNKYHKPYAKEIRDAVIRGDKEIPALEKLRYKLGLTRPREEYEEFFKLTHKKSDYDDYLVGREDGTVWVGSTPHSPIGT